MPYHLEGTGGGEGGTAVTAEELAGGDAHDRRGALGAEGEDGVAHGLVNLVWVGDGDGLIQLLVDFRDQGHPVISEVER